MTHRSPESELNPNDPGDDTFLRYRYQATYAGILSLGMLKNSPDIQEVFVEHHDDILLKVKTQRFTAVQVKTQSPGGAPFKSGDSSIQVALCKFVGHELTFGDLFEHFTIVTNHHFFREKENKSNLSFLSKLAGEAQGSQPSQMDSRLSAAINALLKTFNKGKRGSERGTRDHVLAVFRKLRLDDQLPKLEEGIHQALRAAIGESCDSYKLATIADLELAADALSQLTYRKSSLPVDGAERLFVTYSASPCEEAIAARINAKRITRADVEQLLEKNISCSPMLVPATPVDPRNIPSDLSVAEKKMTAGGLSATTVAASQDWLASAQYLQRIWAMKFNEKIAMDRYNHVAVAVQSACSEAHESTVDELRQGPAMLASLKAILREKREEGTELYDCDEEHLLGHATIRTGQCKVWWSKAFKLT